MTHIVAFFDMDRTILSDSSGLLYMRYLLRQRVLGPAAVVRAYWYAALYKLGALDYPSVAAKLASTATDSAEKETRALCQRWFDEMAINYVTEKAVQTMDRHRMRGHLVTIISASTPYVVGPVAAHLGIDEFLCTRLEIVNGKFTGKILKPACYGSGKVHWAKEYARRHNADLTQAFFYTDSYSDQALLEAVGHPIAVNPDPRLRALASQRDWPIEYFY
jgi:putative phosphoserine phosphatase/1-acylglycerol-3-phosphate O-acyltransferase